jgi:hypothetical protein
MRSVADDLRRSQRERVAAMSVGERVELAFRLGEGDLDLFCAVQHLPRDVARRLLARSRRIGRRPSGVMDGDEP